VSQPMKRMLFTVVLLAGLCAGAAAHADEFADANADYAAQRYEQAIQKYEDLAKGGLRHETLYYNLGNAYFRAAQQGQTGKLGQAILAYERALSLDPDMEDARYNLTVAREIVASRYGKDTVVGEGGAPLWIRVANWIPFRVALWVFLILDALLFAGLVALRFLPTGFARTSIIVTVVFDGAAVLIVGALLFFSTLHRATTNEAIVVADEVIMREGPDESRRELPKLHAGHRLEVMAENQDWVKVRLANRMEGWVQKQTVIQLAP
jgi:hypothetical protein